MTKFILNFLLVLMATAVSTAAQAETLLERGVRQYNAGQYTDAIATLMSAVQQNNRDPAAHYNLGNAFMRTKDTIRAAREYELGYSLAGVGPVATYCRSALAGIRQQGGKTGVVNVTRTSGPYTGPRSNVRCPVGTESHHDGGVQRVGRGLPPDEWAVWSVQFDYAFRKLESKIFAKMVPNWQDMSGECELYYSVDRNHRLRARINRSTADDSVNAACLEVARALDGTNLLNFPPTVHADEFNFYHGVRLYELVMAMKREGYSTNTSATMTSTNANLRQTGLTAAQQRLGGIPTSTDLNGALRTADVNGRIISKNNKQKELKATQLALPPDTASHEVSGQLVSDPAQKNVDGQLLQDPAQKNVDGQLVTDAAKKDVNGQLIPADPAQKNVSGQLTEADTNAKIAKPSGTEPKPVETKPVTVK